MRPLAFVAIAMGTVVSCGVVHDKRDASVTTEFCDAPAPGCPCVPAWWTRETCYSGPEGTLGVGACRAGKQTCADGILTPCAGEVTPTTEVCNGKDDDCNGIVDDVAEADAGDAGPVPGMDASAQCLLPSVFGLCQYGRYQCGEAGVECASMLGPHGVPEECNGLDDDCNGAVDDGLNNLGACPIPNKVGECARGSLKCSFGVQTCGSSYQPQAETCNGLDDDCNGVNDNNLPDGGALCPPYYYCAGKYGCQYYCPHVFAFDGERFRYETTVGGASLVGRREHAIEGRSASFAPLWVRLHEARVDHGVARAEVLAAEDEIVYFDRAELAVVTHPAGHEIFSATSAQANNLFPAQPEALIALPTASMRAPLTARWMGREDVDLARADGRAARADERKDNFYELDLGEVKGPRAWLVIDGWKLKTLRALEPSVTEAPPRLEVFREGRWEKALDLATPRGDKKAVVFDLSQVGWPEGRYRFRLYTGTHEGGYAMWYLDRVRVAESAPAPVHIERVPAAGAELSFVGAPTLLHEGDHTRPLESVDDGRGVLRPEERTWGRFTRYGDVRALLRASDDAMVVMRRGDGVRLSFEKIPVAADDTRALFLIVDLLYKPRKWLSDAESTPLTARAEPLPFHGMKVYPPLAPFPPRADAAMRPWLTRVYEVGDSRWGR